MVASGIPRGPRLSVTPKLESIRPLYGLADQDGILGDDDMFPADGVGSIFAISDARACFRKQLGAHEAKRFAELRLQRALDVPKDALLSLILEKATVSPC